MATESTTTINLVTVDDSKLDYQGFWESTGENDGELQGTRSSTTQNGASMTFNFNGSYIEVYGTIMPQDYYGAPSSSYVIDGTFSNTFEAPSVPTTMYMQKYYSSPHLTNGPHQLVITSLTEGPLFSLDFVQYVPSSTDAEFVGVSSNDIHSAPRGAPRADMIIAGVTGGVAFLMIMAFLALLIYHRRHRRSGTFTIEDGEDDATRIGDVNIIPARVTPYREGQPGPPIAWNSKSGNRNLSTTRPKRASALSIQPPEYDQAIGTHTGCPFTPQLNVYGQHRSSSDPHIYLAEDFEVLPISR
jgi:hypothetical protein